MNAKNGNAACKPNPALAPFHGLIGEWKTAGSHPYLPGVTLLGHSSFEWGEGGAFLIMRSTMDDSRIPDGIAIFGSDDAAATFYLLYFDERGVSRKYDVTVGDHWLEWSRNDPHLSQHLRITMEADDASMTGSGRMSRDGGAWEDDLSLTFTRIR